VIAPFWSLAQIGVPSGSATASMVPPEGPLTPVAAAGSKPPSALRSATAPPASSTPDAVGRVPA
jgi:hypothetical protein